MTVHVGAGMLLHGYPCWSEESLDFNDVLDELLHEAGALEPCSQQRRGGWLSDDFLRMIFVYFCEMLEFNLFIYFFKNLHCKFYKLVTSQSGDWVNLRESLAADCDGKQTLNISC